MSKYLLFGYSTINQKNIWDFGNDPYYYSKPFTWGICIPKNRIKVEIGTRIFFYTFKKNAGDYYLTGMMKVRKMLTQVEAANDPSLYCGKEKVDCPFKIKPLESISCPSICKLEEVENKNESIIAKRDCRCNIIVTPNGDYKEFCDGGNHLHIFRKYLHSKIYFVSTTKDSIATKKKIPLLNYIKYSSKFWNHSRFYGYELKRKEADLLEGILRECQE